MLVGIQVINESIDTGCQQSYLNLWSTGVIVTDPEVFNQLGLFRATYTHSVLLLSSLEPKFPICSATHCKAY